MRPGFVEITSITGAIAIVPSNFLYLVHHHSRTYAYLIGSGVSFELTKEEGTRVEKLLNIYFGGVI